jgi:hypothetical protein
MCIPPPCQAMHVSEACEIAGGHNAQGTADEMMQCLSSMDDFGGSRTHAEDQLHEWLRDAWGMQLDPYYLPLTVASQNPDMHTETMLFAVLQPFEVMHCVYECVGDRAFRECFVGPGGLGAIEKYWRNARKRKWGEEHAALQGVDDQGLCFILPLQYHNDGAKIFRGKLTYFYSYSVATTRGVSLKTKLLIIGIEKDKFLPQTEKQIVDYINWCGEVLASGKLPAEGYLKEQWKPGTYRHKNQGQPIAGPFRGAFSAWKGDTEARVMSHKFQRRNFKSNFVCDDCCAHVSIPSIIYTDFSTTAGHRMTKLSHEGYMTKPADELSPWTKHVGWRKERVLWDLMHLLRVSGIEQDFAASLIKCLALENAFGDGNFDAQLKHCRNKMKAWCRETFGVSLALPVFDVYTIGLGTSFNYMPELTGQIKAGDMKYLIAYLSHVANSVVRPDADCTGKLYSSCAWALVQFQKMLDQCDLVMTEEESVDAEACGRLFLLGYHELALLALEAGLALWRLRPKFHYFDEVLQLMLLTLENPGKQTCMNEEDFMGKLKKIYAKTHRSSQRFRGIQRYLLLLKMVWKRM